MLAEPPTSAVLPWLTLSIKKTTLPDGGVPGTVDVRLAVTVSSVPTEIELADGVSVICVVTLVSVW